MRPAKLIANQDTGRPRLPLLRQAFRLMATLPLRVMTPVKTPRANLGRKGTVAVPKGWRLMKLGEVRPREYRYRVKGKSTWNAGFSILVGDILRGNDIQNCVYVRRRAARSKGRK